MESLDWPTALAALPQSEIDGVLSEMRDDELETLAYDWPAWRRPNQAPPPGNWRFWLNLAGRGWGKTRVGAEWVREQATSGDYRYVNLIGATVDDARDIMIEGESGILSVCPRFQRPLYRKSLRRLDWPNGCISLIFTADKPDRLRGKQHQAFWADELAAWGKDGFAWTQAKFGLRLPPNPRAVITTTPKPIAVLRKLVKDPGTVVTTGTTYENRANLDPAFFREVIAEYAGTALGRQELDGHLLEEAKGSLWRRAWIDRNRVAAAPKTLVRTVLGVDPPGGKTECGLVVAGIGDEAEELAQYYVLGDFSEQIPAAEWARKAWRIALQLEVDVVAVEKNFGGDMVKANLDASAASEEFAGRELPRLVFVNASRGKSVRAEPWSTRAEQGRVHHVGALDELEDELCNWVPNSGMPSPNRLDSVVWALEGCRAGRFAPGIA